MEPKNQCHSMLRLSLFYKMTSILQYLFRHKTFWGKLYGTVKKGVWGNNKPTFPVSNFIDNSEGTLSSEFFV